MRKLLMLAAAAALSAHATTVTATITDATGTAVSGTCTIQAISPFTGGPYRVVGSPAVVAFTSGVFSVSLVPTDTATPAGQYYRVSCQTPRQTVGSGASAHTTGPAQWGPKYWIVPTSSGALNVGTVEVSSAPTPSITFLPSQISQSGATEGDCLVAGASTPVWGSCAEGSTGAVTSVAGRDGNVVLAISDIASLQATLDAKLVKASNLLDLASVAAARTNLGLGTAAVKDTGTGSANVILGNDARLTDARTPAAHASSHASAGSDPLTAAAIGAAPAAKGVTNGDLHDHNGGGGAQIAYGSLSGLPTLGTVVSKAAVTSLGSPGSDANVPTEAAVRAAISSAGGGDASGPASAVNGNFASFSGASGKLIQDSGSKAADFATAGHNHAGVYEPVDATILRQANLTGSGTATTPAKSDHTHAGVYQPAASSFTPSAHATSHKNGGTDEVATATAAANAIPKAGAGGTLASGWFPTLNQSTSGNAATATALAADPAGCTNQFTRDIDASGTATCASVAGTDFSVQLANKVLAGPTTGTSAAPTFRSLVAADVPTLNQSTTGNAATATALAADPTACTSGQYVSDIAANGTLTCGTPSGSGHTQNTDTGTTATCFQLDTDAGTAGPKLCNDGSGGYVVKDASDNPLFAVDTSGVVTFGAGTSPWNLTGYTDDVAPGAPGTVNQFTAYVDRTLALLAYHLNGDANPKYPALGKWATFAGPTAARTYTLPDANKTLLATDGSAASLTSFPTLNQSTTGNAATATALAADPAGCTNQFTRDINASGTATCASVAGTDFAVQIANKVLAGPTTGADAAPTFRALVVADIPGSLNQNTTGTAANLSGTPALPNGTTATTQTAADNTTKLATTAYADAAAAARAASNAATTVNGQTCTLGSTCTVADSTKQVSDAALTALAAGSDFVQFTGPTSSIKVFTLPDANKTLLATDGSAASLTSFPTFNQNTTGTAGGLSGSALGGDATNSGNTITVTKINGKTLTLPYGCAVGDPAGAALATGVLCYITVPMAGTITGWDIVADSGTATVDVWKIATGTAKPTVTNTITASAKPAISTGTVKHSTTLTSWTTSVAANDVIGFNLDIAGPKYITISLQIAH